MEVGSRTRFRRGREPGQHLVVAEESKPHGHRVRRLEGGAGPSEPLPESRCLVLAPPPEVETGVLAGGSTDHYDEKSMSSSTASAVLCPGNPVIAGPGCVPAPER